ITLLNLIFFFQEEDGIRDGHVTGVQTCALPISMLVCSGMYVYPSRETRTASRTCPNTRASASTPVPRMARSRSLPQWCERAPLEIGRASCRERVEGAEGAGS